MIFFRFFGSYTLLECSQILTHESSWRGELLNELADDCFIIFSNLSLEMVLMESRHAEIIITMLLNLTATRAAQNELHEVTGRPGMPLDTYRYVLSENVF